MNKQLLCAQILFSEIAKRGQSLPFPNYDFMGACLQCDMSSYQRLRINSILRGCGFDPIQVWTRFARRAVKLNPLEFNPKNPFDHSHVLSNCIVCSEEDEFRHEFWRGRDFFHVLADICANGIGVEGDVRLPDHWCNEPGDAFWDHYGR